MEAKQFDKIIKNALARSEKVLLEKSAEYAHEGDRLYNFKAAARHKNETPEKALWGMAAKHLVCVEDLVEGRPEPGQPDTLQSVDKADGYKPHGSRDVIHPGRVGNSKKVPWQFFVTHEVGIETAGGHPSPDKSEQSNRYQVQNNDAQIQAGQLHLTNPWFVNVYR